MSALSPAASLRFQGLHEGTSLYSLHQDGLLNRYFVVSHPGTRRLMAFPEVVGYDSYLAMLPATVAALRHLFPSGPGGDVDILTILRGGLNYPLEEACARNGIRVRDIHFVSCERIIEDQVITGLEIKYEKLRASRDRTLLIGDIIATGDTLRLCLGQVIDRFRRRGGSIRRIVFFTVGGTRALDLMEEMTPAIRKVFPEFEGFTCFFYEGIFTVYDSPGASGINVPDIDFGWKGGAVSPEFRRYVLSQENALLEKCIIYDGGARRYEIPVHFREVLDYWEGIRDRADRIDPARLVGEKLGYTPPIDFDKWVTVNHFQELPPEELQTLWKEERACAERAPGLGLREVAEKRIEAIQTILQQYA